MFGVLAFFVLGFMALFGGGMPYLVAGLVALVIGIALEAP